MKAKALRSGFALAALAGGGWLAPVGEEILPLNQTLQLNPTMQVQQTPLPASAWLFLSGLAGLGLLGRKKMRGRKEN